jgi:spore maturation protein SpmA
MFSKIWSSFFILSFISSLYFYFFDNQANIFQEIIQNLFKMAKLSFELALGLTGIITFWLGMMNIANKSGIVASLSKLLTPVFRILFPKLPESHPAIASMMMNFSANFIGLDNAATPFGLKAMQDLQSINDDKETASNEQIMFLVLNTSGLTLIPISIFNYLFQLGYKNPTELFAPILLSTAASTLGGILITSWFQRKYFFNKRYFIFLFIFSLMIFLTVFGLKSIEASKLSLYSTSLSNLLIFSVIVYFIVLGLIKKIDVYSVFIEGAKEGFQISITIIPFLVGILCSISVLRSSHALDLILSMITLIFSSVASIFVSSVKPTTDTNAFEFLKALPVALMKPLSGSGARGMMIETIKNYGPHSMVSKISAIMQGSTETTLYVIALYFGSVGIKNIRYAIVCGLFADLIGVITAILVSYMFF